VTISLAVGRPTIADRIFSRSIAVDLVLIAGGAALTAIAAQVIIPWVPVPFTLQTFSVLLVGAAIGPIRGAISMALYLVLGLIGLPVFAGLSSGWIVGLATGGYILGFIFAAALVGWFAQLQWDRNFFKMVLAFALGSLVIYAFGVPWLYATYFAGTGDVVGALNAGLWPFLLGDLLKAVVAGALLPLAWRGVSRLDRKKDDPTA
jgi:biotin transport system substrate-specific component